MARTPHIASIAIIFVTFTASVPASAAGSQQEKVAENFLQADSNADGALTLAEFTALIDLNAADGIGRANMVKRMGRQSMAFGRIDANSDGLITTEELSAMAAKAKR
ncbi:MAG: hypothetical protein AAF557_06125 [Pseudomonadota bacterium]